MTGSPEEILPAAMPTEDPARADPFRLAAEPPRVMRLSRKALAVAGGTAGIVIGGALLWALRPVEHEAPENLYDAAANNRSEAVTGAPKDYGAIPKLGPPLPGDLGRPILSAQQEGESVPLAPMGGGAPSSDPSQTAAARARQRVQQERDAAQSSRLFGAAVGTAAPAPERDAASASELAMRPGAVSSPHDFFAQRGGSTESAERIRAASSPYVVQAGSVIPAALITGIHSDLPGQVTAQVTQNVFDSPSGRHLLIPQGARLIGEYDNKVGAGQNRLLLAWDRLILPGGRSIRLDRQPGADAGGKAGIAGRANHHWGSMLRAALVSVMLGMGTEFAADGDDSLVRALREGSQNTIDQTGKRLVERELAVAPTIVVRPGHVLRVVLTRDLVLEPVGGAQ